MPLGTGLTGVDRPGAKPLVPTGALGSAPSEEVTPSGGMTVPTWANAGPQHNRGKITETIDNGLMEVLSDKRPTILPREGVSTAIGKPARSMAFIFIAADRG
jgi:hypothetical protein